MVFVGISLISNEIESLRGQFLSRNLKGVKDQFMQKCSGAFQGNVPEAEAILEGPWSSKRGFDEIRKAGV